MVGRMGKFDTLALYMRHQYIPASTDDDNPTILSTTPLNTTITTSEKPQRTAIMPVRPALLPLFSMFMPFSLPITNNSPGVQQHLQRRVRSSIDWQLPSPPSAYQSPRPRLHPPPRSLSPSPSLPRPRLRVLRCPRRDPQLVPRQHLLPQLRDPGTCGPLVDIWHPMDQRVLGEDQANHER